jgi:putative membrane protein
MNNSRSYIATLIVMLLGLVISGIAPFSRGTWVAEVAPVAVALPVLWLTRARFPLTSLVYWLIAVHATILVIGGHYTYARVPAGFWLQEALDLSRNHYDRLGHLAQGFVPAIFVRELLLRCTPLRVGNWLLLLVTATCLAISACYEFIEWWSALLLGAGADEFLATQGDVWDTQWDLFLALLGAIAAQLLLARWHNRQLAGMASPAGGGDYR